MSWPPKFVLRWAQRLCRYGDLAHAYGELFTVVIRLKGELAHAKPVPWRRRTPYPFRDTVPLPPPPPPPRREALFLNQSSSQADESRHA